MPLRLPWFRRKNKDEQQSPPVPAAPHAETALPESAETATDSTSDRPRRKRGSRGGRGRKKPAGATAVAEAGSTPKQKATPAAKPKADGAAAKPERKPRSSDRGARSSTRRRVAPKRAALPAAKRELLISVSVSEQRAAVLEDGRVAEVYLERPERRSITGNIYLGTVDNVLPGMEAAFVEIGLEKNGFLYVDEIVVPSLEGKRHGKKIQDLIARGQAILVQAVKDPMKSKGARLTTDISLPGRFVVFVPNGEGLGVSRRLPDDERTRLKDVVKHLDIPKGGLIVRTAAEGASADDIERDVVFLQRLWKSIEARAAEVKAPALVYQEAELPLRVIRDLFTGDFERAVVDHERTHKRIVGYLKKTSPHMVERVERHREKTPVLEAHGVDQEIRSTLSRRVDLPSGGYLIFDYAEAFTVIDVNTGRFVGGRGKSSTGRLEDTITKNNLEAVKEVVRQLRLRDIGGIIVIDFIDMANPKNRQTVEEALRTELERDRTKTYVVEISPLGLVEMTRQNVTDGPREILTRRCPTCEGDGVVVSEASAAVAAEQKLRALASGSRVQAFQVELHPRVAALLTGPGATRLREIEAQTRRLFYLVAAADGHGVEHFAVLKQGKRELLAPEAPVTEGQELSLKLVEVGLHDAGAGVGKVDDFDVCVAGAAKLVGKKVRARVERVLDGIAHASWLDAPRSDDEPLTAEREAEKPTRQPRARKSAVADQALAEQEPAASGEAAVEHDASAEVGELPAEAPAESDAASEERPKKRTRRGTRGGRGRKRASPVDGNGEDAEPVEADASTTPEPGVEPVAAPASDDEQATVAEEPAPRIHLPDHRFGRAPVRGPETAPTDAAPQAPEPTAHEPADGPAGDAAEAEADTDGDGAPAKKRTRRGSRGGRNRRKKVAVVPAGEPEAGVAAGQDDSETAAAEPATVAAAALDGAPADGGDGAEDGAERSDWEYVPMSEWEDELRA